MEERKVSIERNRLVVRFPYSNGLIVRIKQLPGHRWESAIGAWTFKLTKQNAEELKLFARKYQFFFDIEVQKFIDS